VTFGLVSPALTPADMVWGSVSSRVTATVKIEIPSPAVAGT